MDPNEEVYIDLIKLPIANEIKWTPNYYAEKETLKEVIRRREEDEDEEEMEEDDGYEIEACEKETTKEDVVKITEEEFEMLKEDHVIGLKFLHVNKRASKSGLSLNTVYWLTNGEKCPKLFNTFWKSCYRRDLAIFCTMSLKKNSAVNYAELLPVVYKDLPVFRLTVLPDYDCVTIEPEDLIKTKVDKVPELREAVCSLMEKMTIEHDTTRFYDTVDRRIVSYVKSQVLNVSETKIEDPELKCDFDIDDELNVLYPYSERDDGELKRKREPE